MSPQVQSATSLVPQAESNNSRHASLFSVVALLLLLLMGILSGGAALRESVTVDEVSHIAAGVSYLQKFDLRLNAEHPPLPKILAAIPLVLRGARADYSHISWTFSDSYFQANMAQWVFGAWFLTKWNDPQQTLAWARLPMLLMTLVLGWMVFVYARRLGGNWGGLLSLSVFVSTPAFLTFGPLVHTDLAITLFTLLTLWKFADLCVEPSRKSAVMLGLRFAGALLSKFTAGILLFAFVAFALSTRWRPVPGQPTEKIEARSWRKIRRHFTWQAILWAALAVYIFYFVFSIRQSSDIFYFDGHNPAFLLLRRLMMPVWLYVRAVLFVLLTSVRPTFVLGHSYSHGVWFYFPVIFALKSPLGVLGLLLLASVLAIWRKRREPKSQPERVIPFEFLMHWRALWGSLLVFVGFCLLSGLDISIRHFSVPLVLLTLLLAPLPRLLSGLRFTSPVVGRVAIGATTLLALSCLATAIGAYPFFMPYMNSISFGHPAYELFNDSNVDWNQSLPEVKRYIEQHQLPKILLTQYGFTEMPANLSANAEFWDCQQPSPADGNRWAVVSANMILDGHNCGWLLQYPHEAIAGGSLYAFHLPRSIPEPGTAGGPPLPSAYRLFGGAPFDFQALSLNMIRYPERLPPTFADMVAKYKSGQVPKVEPSPKPEP